MPSTLTRYLTGELVLTCATSLGALSTFTLPPAFLSALYKLGGVGPEVLLGFLPLLCAELLPHLVPIAFLLAVTRTVSALVAKREWLAMQMTGRHPLRTLLPVGVVGAVLGLGSMWLLHRTVPPMRYEQEMYLRSAAVEAMRNALKGRTIVQLGGYTVVGRSLEGERIRHAVIRQPGDDEGGGEYLFADEVEIVDLIDRILFNLHEVKYFKGDDVVQLENTRITIHLNEIAPIKLPNADKPSYLTSEEVEQRLGAGPETEKYARRLAYEIEMRTALSATFLIFALVGVLLGLKLGTESMLPSLGFSILFSGVHHVLFQHVGRDLALNGQASAFVGAWAANAVFLLGCLVYIKLRRPW